MYCFLEIRNYSPAKKLKWRLCHWSWGWQIACQRETFTTGFPLCLNAEANYIGWQREGTKQNKREYMQNRWSTFYAFQSLYPFPTKYNLVFYNINPRIVSSILKLFWSFSEINSRHNQAMVGSQFVLSCIACSVLPIAHPPWSFKDLWESRNVPLVNNISCLSHASVNSMKNRIYPVSQNPRINTHQAFCLSLRNEGKHTQEKTMGRHWVAGYVLCSVFLPELSWSLAAALSSLSVWLLPLHLFLELNWPSWENVVFIWLNIDILISEFPPQLISISKNKDTSEALLKDFSPMFFFFLKNLCF